MLDRAFHRVCGESAKRAVGGMRGCVGLQRRKQVEGVYRTLAVELDCVTLTPCRSGHSGSRTEVVLGPYRGCWCTFYGRQFSPSCIFLIGSFALHKSLVTVSIHLFCRPSALQLFGPYHTEQRHRTIADPLHSVECHIVDPTVTWYPRTPNSRGHGGPSPKSIKVDVFVRSVALF